MRMCVHAHTHSHTHYVWLNTSDYQKDKIQKMEKKWTNINVI